MRNLGVKIAAIGLAASVGFAPITASAQAYHHRQQTKNTWRNLAIGSGAVGLYGLLKGNSTLGLLGAAGAGYSAYRYEQDRKSQRAMRDRAAYYRSHHGYAQRFARRHKKRYHHSG